MKDKLQLTIVSPEKQLFQGEVKRVTVPGIKGSFSILPNHAPIISTLAKGKLAYIPMSGEEQILDIEGGVVELNDNNISVCVS